jgi:hypothetical protein
MKTWVRRLNSYEEVPEEFRAEFSKQDASFPYTLFIPEDRLSMFHKRNAKILCLYDDRFLMLEKVRDQINTATSLYDEILYIEHGEILLNSWLKITSKSGTISFKFNTANVNRLELAITNARLGMSAPRVDQKNTEEYEFSKFDHLSSINYKYMNLGRQSLCPGDAVQQIVYQPERCIYEGITFLKKTIFRRFATSHLSILTDKELILIKESKPVKSERTTLYGGVFTYIPRQKIQNITFKPDPEKPCSKMEIALPNNIIFSSEFSQDNSDLDALQQKCGSFISQK